MAAPTPNSVGWFILEGYPWWPVFVVDQYKLRPKLYHLGDGHRGILKKARDFPKDYAIVYYFGSHEFSLAHLNKGVLRTWDCDDKEDFLKGHPKHLAKKKATMDDLTFSIQEAEDYLAQPEDIRLPPYFVPSDLDPTLEPPPPPEIEEDEEGSDEENVSDAGDAEDPDAEEGAQSDDHEEDDEEDEDAPTKKNAKKKKEKKEKPKKEKKEKKKDKKKDKKSDAKEKKTAKASSSKEKKKTPKSPKAEPKKRKAEAVEKIASSKSPSKASKHAAGEDVKSADVKTEKSGRKDVKMADPESDADLTAKLEKEIRWILLNCQFEEMTTKTVRKLLEKRLEMDLRHHKASIKEGVARVIQSMEDDTNQDADQEAGQEAGGKSTEDASAQSVKAEPPQPEGTAAVKEEVKSDPSVIKNEVKSDPSVIKNEVKSDPSVIKDEIKSDPSAIKDEIKSDPSAANESSSPKKVENAASSSKIPVAEQLEDAAKRLSASPLSDEQILDILTSVAAISSVDPNVLKKSKLQERLVALVSHSSSVVSSKVLALGKQWDIETVLSPKKEVDLNYLKELKAKLENSDTSHEDICTSLDELAEMPLQISHLKKTKIARTVANLRQHANDRVSSKANSLRRSWIQTLSKENPENVETLKTLKKMHETLAQRDDQSDKPGDVHSAQLEILNKLLGMTLRTQDIIDSKVGVVVSKLRKSSDEKVAKAASKLRKKWKSEAGAA